MSLNLTVSMSLLFENRNLKFDFAGKNLNVGVGHATWLKWFRVAYKQLLNSAVATFFYVNTDDRTSNTT